MTEAPTVNSPTGPAKPVPLTGTNSTATPEGDDTSGEIRCVCGFEDDDGFTICCDKCELWQHIVCMGISTDEVPNKYLCSDCDPRPINVERAKELQQARKNREENKAKLTRSKKKQPTSHKRKESHSGSLTAAGHHHNNNNHNYSTSHLHHHQDAKSVNRAPSPHNGAAGTTSTSNNHNRKRHAKPSESGQHKSHSRRSSPTESKKGEHSDEDDATLKQYKSEFADITGKPDMYLSEQVHQHVKQLAQQADGDIKRLAKDSLSTLPKTSVRLLQNSKGYTSFSSRHKFVLDSSCGKGKLVSVFKGEVGYLDAYKKDAYNQYPITNHPKPQVLFHPSINLYVDARRYGTDSRFARTSCRPSVSLQTIVVGDELLLGLFAVESLSKGTEITVPWAWDCSEAASKFLSHRDSDSPLSKEILSQATEWVAGLHAHVGECACERKNECLLDRIASSSTRPPLSNGTTTSRKRGKNPDTSIPSIHKEHASEDEDPSTTSSTTTKQKPKTLDLSSLSTPEFLLSPSDGETLSKREASKMRQYVSQIERMEQQHQQQQAGEQATPAAKRRKRHSTVGLAPPVLENGKRGVPRSPLPTPNGSRRVSDGSVKSAPDESTGSGSGMGVAATPTLQIRKKKPVYVDSSVQTDEETCSWWLRPTPSVPSPTRAPPLSLKKRLMMQCLVRERELERERSASAVPSSTDENAGVSRKRKSEDMSDGDGDAEGGEREESGSPRKEPRLEDGGRSERGLPSGGTPPGGSADEGDRMEVDSEGTGKKEEEDEEEGHEKEEEGAGEGKKYVTADTSPITPKSEDGNGNSSAVVGVGSKGSVVETTTSTSNSNPIKPEEPSSTPSNLPTPITPLPPTTTTSAPTSTASTTISPRRLNHPTLNISLPPPQPPSLAQHLLLGGATSSHSNTPFSPDGSNLAAPSPRSKKVITLGDYTAKRNRKAEERRRGSGGSSEGKEGKE